MEENTNKIYNYLEIQKQERKGQHISSKHNIVCVTKNVVSWFSDLRNEQTVVPLHATD